MYALAITHQQRPARWLVFLAGAVCVLQAGLAAMPLERTREPAVEVPQLRLTLQTRAAPLRAIEPKPADAPAMQASSPLPRIESMPAAVKKVAPVPKTKMPPETVTPPPEPALTAVRLVRKPPVPAPAAERPRPEAATPVEIEEPAPPKRIAVDAPPLPEPDDSPDNGASIKTQTAAVVEEARYRKQTPPVYPRRSLDLGEQGVVMLHVAVLPSGDPDEVKVQASSGFRRLDLAAMAAVRKWEFEPVLARGERKITWVRVPVRFVIRNN